MPKLQVTIDRRDEIATATWAFTFGTGGQGFSFKPGQTIDLTYPNMPVGTAARLAARLAEEAPHLLHRVETRTGPSPDRDAGPRLGV